MSSPANPAPLMLSVSGMRGLIGQSLTPPLAARYAAAFGQWLAQSNPDLDAPRVVIGRDSRPSGPMIQMAAVAGLLGAGCKVTELGIATTPGVAIMVEHHKAQGGMVITASHNPIIWNGIKALRHDGVAPPPDQAQQIIQRFQQDQIQYAGVEKLHTPEIDLSTAQIHVQRILANLDVLAIRQQRFKVVLDSVHGAGGPSTAYLLEQLGVQLIHLGAQPHGRFPHPPEPTREHLTGLAEAVRQHQADLGFAQDPDADRLAIVDEQGVYIGEEYTLALASLHMLDRAGNKARGATLAANLSTSRMIDDIAQQAGASVLRTPVGEANVAAAMRSCGCLMGGEGNGGVIWPAVIHVRDSLGGIGLILELLARRGKPLSRIVASIPSYAIVKDKVNLAPGMAEKLAPTLRQHYSGQKIDQQDGVRVDWPDRWVHVRTSNTEPIMRIIAEARDQATANALIADVRRTLGL